MKQIFSIIAISLLLLSACKTKDIAETNATETQTDQLYACSMHPEVIGKKGEKCSKCSMKLTVPVKEDAPETTIADTTATAPTTDKTSITTTPSKISIKGLLDPYIQLKNALTKDNSNDAAKAGKALEAAFKSFDKSALSVEQKKTFDDIEEDAREHAEHIGANAGKIAHQREHFDMLSKDMYDLVKAFGAGQTLYKDFCPMYNDNKGAIWLSESKEIKNPYYGKSMLTCGSMKEELK